MRHDIDLSLEHAVNLARVEADLGITSTYFVMVRSDFYNVFSRAGAESVRSILQCGHALGLHFDCAAYPEMSDAPRLASCSAMESSLLQQWFDVAVTVVSYHRPQPIILSGDPSLSHPLPHTYMKKFTKEIRYLSDSQGRWKYGSPLQTKEFRESRSMHILTHPIWWDEQPSESLQKLNTFLARRLSIMQIDLAANCTIYTTPQKTIKGNE